MFSPSQLYRNRVHSTQTISSADRGITIVAPKFEPNPAKGVHSFRSQLPIDQHVAWYQLNRRHFAVPWLASEPNKCEGV